MRKYDFLIGKEPIGMTQETYRPLVVFDINDEYAITGFYADEGTYENIRQTNIHVTESGRMYLRREKKRYYVDDILKIGTMWIPHMDICEKIV